MVPSRLQFAGEPDFGEPVELFVREFTEPGDLVFDPFAGSGATIAKARELGRRGLGIEIVPALVTAAQQRLGADRIIQGDARRLADLGLPTADLVLTSPPFMTVTHHPQNPLSGYQSLDGDYPTYLNSLRSVVTALCTLVRSGGHIVLNVWNFWHGELYTPLADDLQRTLVGLLPLEKTVDIIWGASESAPVNDRCLIYRVPDPE